MIMNWVKSWLRFDYEFFLRGGKIPEYRIDYWLMEIRLRFWVVIDWDKSKNFFINIFSIWLSCYCVDDYELIEQWVVGNLTQIGHYAIKWI